MKRIWKERCGSLSHITWCRKAIKNLFLKMEIPWERGLPKYHLERKFQGVGDYNIKTLHGGMDNFWNYTIRKLNEKM